MEPTPIEEFLIKIQTGNRNKKVIGHLYQIFLGMNPNDTLQMKESWENEMNIHIQQDMWEEMCTEAHLVSNSNTWQKFW